MVTVHFDVTQGATENDSSGRWPCMQPGHLVVTQLGRKSVAQFVEGAEYFLDLELVPVVEPSSEQLTS